MRPAVGFVVYVVIFFPRALAKIGWQEIRRGFAMSKFRLEEMETRPWSLRGMRVAARNWPLRYRILFVVVCLLLGAFLLFIVGCAGQPRNMSELFPPFNRDPLEGLWVVEGSAPFNFEILDQSGRAVASGGDSGTSPFFTFNGRSPVRIYRSDTLHLRLTPGYYTIGVRSFYWVTTIAGRYPQRLYNQTYSLTVTGNNPSACPEDQYTHWDWGWCLRISPGDIPQRQPLDAISFPQINIGGTGIIGDAIEWLRRR